MANSKKTEYEIAIQVAGKIAASFEQSMRSIDDRFDAMANMASQVGGRIENSFATNVQNVNGRFDAMANMASQVGGRIENSFAANVQNVNGRFNTLTNMAKTAAKMITATFATVQVGQFIESSVKTYSQFEQSMANTAAVAQATRYEYQQLQNAAKEMGKATTKTAAEAADALGYMMLAGWDVKESIAGLEPVLRLSEATQMDLATCSDLVTDSMSALGLSVEELSNYLDVCTAANNNANTTAGALMEAFIGCGGAAKTIGADLIDTATALGVLANNGTKGAEAGTALNSMLVRMTSKDAAIKAMKKLGVTAFDSTGQFRGLETVLVDLQAALSKLTPEKQASYMSKIAGTNYYTEMSYLLDAVGKSTSELAESTKDVNGAWAELAKTAATNQSAWSQLSGNLEDSDGALLNMANTVTDTLQGAFSRLNSAVDDAKINVANVFAGDLKDNVNKLSEYIPTLTQKFIDFSTKAEPKISKTFQTITEGAKNAWEMVSGIGGWAIENFDTIEKVIAGLGGAIISYKVIHGLVGTASAIQGVASALKAMTITNPWLSGVTLATSAIVGITSSIKTAEKQAAKSNLANHFGTIALSMEDISEVAEHIVSNDYLSKIHESLTAFDELDGMKNSMQDSIDAINKMNWKVSIGMKLSKDDQDSYLAEIQNYIGQTQEYVNQNQYAINLNLATFAEGDLERQNLINQLNAFYTNKSSELEAIGTKLNETVTKAFQDGLLDIDEAKEIRELQLQMARIQESLAGDDFEASLKVIETQYSGVGINADSFRASQEKIEEAAEAASEKYEESLKLQLATFENMKKNGVISQAQYTFATKESQKDHLIQMAELEAKALQSQTDEIMNRYGSDIENFHKHTNEVIAEYSNRDWEWEEGPRKMWDGMIQAIYSNDIPKDTRDALTLLMEQMESSIERAEKAKSQLENLGVDVPQSLTNALSDTNLLSAMTVRKKFFGTSGNIEAVSQMLGEKLADNTYFQKVTDTLQEKGYYVPDGIIEGMELAQKEKVLPAIEGMYAYSNTYLNEVLSKGFDVSADVTVALHPVYYQPQSSPSSPLLQGAIAGLNLGLGGHANGGIFDYPHIAWFAEKGPEAAIPLDGSDHAISLWQQAGQILGAFEDKSNQRKEIDPPPSFTIPQQEKVLPAIQNMYANTYLNEVLSKGFDVSADVAVALHPVYYQPQSSLSPPLLQGAIAGLNLGLGDRVVSMWESVGQLLGAFQDGEDNSKATELYHDITNTYQTMGNKTTQESTDSRQFIFSPQITIEGHASREDVENAIHMSMEDFKELFEQYLAEKERGSFT